MGWFNHQLVSHVFDGGYPCLSSNPGGIFFWVFPKIGVPQNGWFIMENPMNKWMIWGETPTIFGNTLLKLTYKLSLSFLLSLFYRPRPSWYPMAMNGPGRGQAQKKWGDIQRLMAWSFPAPKKDDDDPMNL